MRIAVVSTGTLDGSGYATRVCSMLQAYADAGHEVDLFHARFPVEPQPPVVVRDKLRAYHGYEVPFGGMRSNHLHVYPPTMRACDRAAAGWEALQRAGGYDVVQSESINVWTVGKRLRAARRVVVFHDDDWVRLRRAARVAPDPLRRAVRSATALKYRALQWRIGEEADLCVFVSEPEMAGALARRPGLDALLVPNGAAVGLYGVDAPADRTAPAVAFTGPAVYRVNVVSVGWFLNEVWPQVRAVVPGAEFRLVGRGWERMFASDPAAGVRVVGFADDLGAELGRARVAVAPLLAGGGTKLKVVEAMAAARPVVATSVGAEGLPPSPGLAVADDPVTFAGLLVQRLVDPERAGREGAANRSAVEHLRWSEIWPPAIERLERLVGDESLAA